MTAPAISVLIAVHNGQPYVESAIRSIMEQTFRDIEIVVVDDASTDDTPEVLARLAAEDPRLRIETAKTNLRLPGALNHGLTLCRAPLIARMDADDIALPTRLEVQKAYMDAHPGVVLMGTSIQKIDDAGTLMNIEIRDHDAFATRWLSNFYMPLVHPTFLFRNPASDGPRLRYDASLPTTQDYDFVLRAQDHGDVVSIPDVLLQYRVHAEGTSVKKAALQRRTSRGIMERFHARSLPAPIAEKLNAVRDARYEGIFDKPAIFDALRTLIRHDSAQTPARAAWMRRKAADLVLYHLRTHRRGRKEQVWTFLRYGPDFILPLRIHEHGVRKQLAYYHRQRHAAASAPTGQHP